MPRFNIKFQELFVSLSFFLFWKRNSPMRAQAAPLFRCIHQTHTHMHTHSVGLPWKSDQLVADAATYTRDEQPCHQRDSNPQSHGHWDRIYLYISYLILQKSMLITLLPLCVIVTCHSQLMRGLRSGCATVCWLGLRVQIPMGIWIPSKNMRENPPKAPIIHSVY
jgi:hypothetical protein